MKRILLLAFFSAVLAVGTLAGATSAVAKKTSCVAGQKGGPKCKYFDAKVKWAADGDTLKPRLKEGKGWSRTRRTVRMTAIQAPELKNYSRRSRKGECMGVEATEVLDKFVHRSKLRLVTMKAKAGGGKRGRLRSSLQVMKGGKWVDPAMTLLEKGLVLWSSDGEEWAWNGVYSRLAEQAAAKGVGLWNPEACGKAGPSPFATRDTLTMKVKWDANGSDTANGEWVRIKNSSPAPVPLKGWRLRDPGLLTSKMKSGFRFPSNAVIPPNGSVTVFVGKGSQDAGRGVFHWGESKPLFQNATNDKKQVGDAVFLFDPDDEIRAHVQYPCRTTCPEPLAGKMSVQARYKGTTYEWVTVRNTSSETVSLNEYELESVPSFFYEFGPADVLQPGQGLVVFANKRPNMVPLSLTNANPLVPALPFRAPFQGVGIFREWGYTKPMFGDKSDAVLLRSPLGTPLACHNWGGDKCPGV